MQIVFWLSATAVAYTYVGYPLLLAVLAYLRPRYIQRNEWQELPKVSLIITAYNEERDLAAKLENTLGLDYPSDKLEIIVASDCSTDRTDDIVRSFASKGVYLHRQSERLGKTAAQNAAIECAHGEIVIFSDATTLYQTEVLHVILPNFSDPSIGCVAGRLVYIDPTQSDVGRGARSYWNYETFLKQNESRIGSLIGVSGCLYAVRRSAYIPLYHDACSDFIIATKMVEQGLRTVYEPAAICTEETNRQAQKELSMRVRVITQTYADLWRHRYMLNPVRAGFYAIQLLSHKVMRYLVPLFLFLILVSTALLARQSNFFTVVFGLQLCVYVTAFLAWVLEKFRVPTGPLSIPLYFVLTNIASLLAFYRFVKGDRFAKWEPIREPASKDFVSSASTSVVVIPSSADRRDC